MKTYRFVLRALACLAIVGAARAQPALADATMDELGIFRACEFKCRDGPPSLPKGGAVGHPRRRPKQGRSVSHAVGIPNRHKVMPHVHPKTERVLVIVGALHLGMGATFGAKATRLLPAVTFGYWAAGMKHSAYAEGETVPQLHESAPGRSSA